MTKSAVSARQTAAENAGKRAINDALDLFQRRWTLKILWELSKATYTFRQLQSACDDASASVLNLRLAELRSALLVEHDPGTGYRLAEEGRSLMIAIEPLLRWAPHWAEVVARSEGKPGR